jgi:hypothetical protein
MMNLIALCLPALFLVGWGIDWAIAFASAAEDKAALAH